MSDLPRGLETTRIQTSLGNIIVVSHPNGVRVGLAFAQQASAGRIEWHAQCVDWYGQGVPPISSRLPQVGGYAGLDELERALIEEVAAPMQTDYWSDR